MSDEIKQGDLVEYVDIEGRWARYPATFLTTFGGQHYLLSTVGKPFPFTASEIRVSSCEREKVIEGMAEACKLCPSVLNWIPTPAFREFCVALYDAGFRKEGVRANYEDIQGDGGPKSWIDIETLLVDFEVFWK